MTTVLDEEDINKRKQISLDNSVLLRLKKHGEFGIFDNNPHPFKEFSDIITLYQDTGRANQLNSSTEIRSSDNSRCLQCQRQISLSQYSPYCSSHCMNEHDKGIKIDHKGSEKNAFLKFSDIFTQ